MKLSIITINFNNAYGLEQTLNSILTQNFRDYEQIIIDGGSTDESLKVIRQFENRAIQPFKWVSEIDNGIYHAQNKGIMKATGEYCLFLNSGDYLANETVLSSVFKGNLSVDIIWGNLIVIDKEKTTICKGKKEISFLDIYSSIIKHQASFIKRTLFDKYGLYDESLKIVADWAFFLKTVGFEKASLKYLDLNISCFENNGISNNNPDICAQERQTVLDHYISPLMQKDYMLLHKYRGIKKIEKSKIAYFLFKVLVRCIK